MSFAQPLLMIVLLLTTTFLIVLILIQRGKGGGLAGAFGGMGGQSAFGTKAGDLFTRITIGVATFWIILCIVMVKVLGGASGGPLSQDIGAAAEQRPGISASPDSKSKPGEGKDASPASPVKTPVEDEGKP